MTVDKLSRLFSALGGSTQGYSSTNSKKAETEAATTAVRSTEAVAIANNFGQNSEAATEASRKARVEEIKSQVKNGSYKVDSAKVAEALARDLFA